MGDYYIDWRTWEQPTNSLALGLQASGERISTSCGRAFIEVFVRTCFEDCLEGINDEFGSHIELRSLDIERSSIVCYFKLGSQRDATVFTEDARRALLLLLARIGEALRNDKIENIGKIISEGKLKRQAAQAWNY